MLYAYSDKELARKSEQAQDTINDEQERLAEAYVQIGLVYANRAARRGERVSIVKAPYEVHEEIEELLKQKGFDVSDFGFNFFGNPMKLNAFCIRW